MKLRIPQFRWPYSPVEKRLKRESEERAYRLARESTGRTLGHGTTSGGGFKKPYLQRIAEEALEAPDKLEPYQTYNEMADWHGWLYKVEQRVTALEGRADNLNSGLNVLANQLLKLQPATPSPATANPITGSPSDAEPETTAVPILPSWPSVRAITADGRAARDLLSAEPEDVST